MLNDNLKRAQDFVIGECLSDYPPEATYAEIRELILDDDNSVTVWEPFEYCDILHIMDNMLSATVRLLEAK